MHALSSLLPALLRLIAIEAHAQISGAANTVANGLLSGFGGGGFAGITMYLRGQVVLILAPIGIFLIVRAGLRLITSEDDNKLNKAKQTIASTCVGLILAFIAQRLVDAFYTPGGAWHEGSVGIGASIIATEVGGIIDWVLVLAASLAILMIVVSGVQSVSSFGKDEGAQKTKQAASGAVTGLVILTLGGAIKLALGLSAYSTAALPGTPDAGVFIGRSIIIIASVLQYLSLAALAVIIYAGILMVFNLGNDEQYNRAKKIVYTAVIGLIVVLLSGMLARFVLELFV